MYSPKVGDYVTYRIMSGQYSGYVIAIKENADYNSLIIADSPNDKTGYLISSYQLIF